jgi:hypothetical protein
LPDITWGHCNKTLDAIDARLAGVLTSLSRGSVKVDGRCIDHAPHHFRDEIARLEIGGDELGADLDVRQVCQCFLDR